MTASLRFGPTPPDLVAVRRLPKPGPGFYTRGDFAIVRARIGGHWVLGVACEWTWTATEGTCVRIITPINGAGMSQWYRFQPESVDRIRVDADTGLVDLIPPS